MAEPPTPSEFEATLQMPRLAAPVKDRNPSHQAIAIVEGSGEGLSQQTSNLRCERLRIASLLLCVAYSLFFIRNLFELHTVQTTADWLLFWNHAVVIVLTGLVGLRLSMRCPTMRQHLGLTEFLVFGGSALDFILFTHVNLVQGSAAGYLTPITPPWLLLIYVYALFIPNPWKRAAGIIGAMAAAPILTMLFTWLTSPNLSEIIRTVPAYHNLFSTAILVMAIAALTAIAGVRAMGRLRREAFEARQIGQYRLKRLLGSGGMGDVYLAEHVLLKRPCAIKLIKPEKMGDTQALARFELEVQATARLTHWNTVEIFDYGRAEDGTFYYVMEYLPGMNLDQLVAMHGPLPPERVIHLIAQTCDALEEAHAQQLIHRDIKPANIFAAKRGGVYDVAKLLDFGLAKPLSDVGDSQLTQEGTIAGSPLFMSPEQVTGEAPDARSDIYSLGVVMYFLLTGRRPFEGENPMKILIAHAHDAPEPVNDVNPDIPGDIADVVMRCLEKDRDHRFPNVMTLRQMLLDCTASGHWTREQATEWWQCSGCPHKKALDAEVFGEQALDTELTLASV